MSALAMRSAQASLRATSRRAALAPRAAATTAAYSMLARNAVRSAMVAAAAPRAVIVSHTIASWPA